VRVRLLALAAAALVLAGCGGGTNVLARVGDQQVTQKQVDDGITYLEYEAKLEGHAFPAEGTPERKQAERDLVDVLVRRARFEAKAEQLGIFVSLVEVRARIGGDEATIGKVPGEAFHEATVRAAILYGRLYDHVTRRVTVSVAEARTFYGRHRKAYPQPFADVRDTLRGQLLAARKTAAMRRWERQVERELPVRKS
jgi:hypothetical protein